MSKKVFDLADCWYEVDPKVQEIFGKLQTNCEVAGLGITIVSDIQLGGHTFDIINNPFLKPGEIQMITPAMRGAFDSTMKRVENAIEEARKDWALLNFLVEGGEST